MTGRESHLHNSLKDWYMREGDVCEARVGGIVADILRPRKKVKDRDLIIEIQTGSFGKLVPKLPVLLESYSILLVFPLIHAKRLKVYGEDGLQLTSDRKSPKRQNVYDIFSELMRLPYVLSHPFFQFEAVFTVQEEIRIADGAGSWRRKGVSIRERRLVEVAGVERFNNLADYRRLIPGECLDGFTCSSLAKASGCTRKAAQKMAYCLSRAGLLRLEGKTGRENLYRLVL